MGLCVALLLRQLTRIQLMELWGCSSPHHTHFWAEEVHNNSKAWYSIARPIPRSYKTGPKLSLVVKEAELRHLLAQLRDKQTGVAVESQPVYAEEYSWRLRLYVTKRFQLWCSVQAQGLQSVHSLHKSVTLSHGTLGSLFLSIRVDAAKPLILISCKYIPIGYGSGANMTGDCGEFPESDNLEWWSDYIVDGCVSFTAVTKSVSA